MPSFLPLPCSAQEVAIITAFASPGAAIGPSFLGIVLSSLLYGIACCQAYSYFHSERAKDDRWILKYSVVLLMLVTTFQQAFITHGLYYYLVENFADSCTFFQHVIWSLPADIALNVPTQIVVEGFMVYRTWHLGRNMYISGACALLTLVASVLSIVYTVQLVFIKSLLGVFTDLRSIAIAALVFLAFADTCTSAAVALYLYRGRTGLGKSDSLITRLVRFTISTNILTTMVAIAAAVVVAVGSRGFYANLFSFVLDKLYIIGMLAVLNLRSSLNKSLVEATNQVDSLHLSRLPGDPPPQCSLTPVEIQIDRNLSDSWDAESDTYLESLGRRLSRGSPAVDSLSLLVSP